MAKKITRNFICFTILLGSTSLVRCNSDDASDDNVKLEREAPITVDKEEVSIDPKQKEIKETTSREGTSLNFELSQLIKNMFQESEKTKDMDNTSDQSANAKQNTTSELNRTNNIVPLINRDEINKTEVKTKFKCIGRNVSLENITSEVKIINNTRLLQVLNFERNDTLSDCVLVMFYAPWCRFCATVAPSYNALARAFPELDIVAVDAAHFSNLNARFGTVSVPNILLFHQSRAVVRFNQTDKQFENLVSFVKNHTGMEPDSTVNVTESDYIGPLQSVPSEETDYLLWISWLFVVIFMSVVFVRSSQGQRYINRVKILWQEHQHID